MRALILAILLCLATPAIGEATVYFEENYEVTLGNVDCVTFAGPCTQAELDLVAKGWVHMDGASSAIHPSRFDIVNVTGHTGASTKALRMTYNGVESSSNPATGRLSWTCDGCYEGSIMRLFPATSDYYERYWARYDKIDSTQYGGPVPPTDPFTNGGGKHHYIYNNSGNNPSYAFFTGWGEGGWFDFSTQITNSAGVNFTCPPFPQGDGGSNASCNVWPVPRNNNVTMGVWHCIENHTGTNKVEGWVDGVLTFSTTLTNFTPPTGFNLVKVFRQHGENYYRYEDDFAVGNVRFNDCGGAPQPDTTPPAIPVNVAIAIVTALALLGGLYGGFTTKPIHVDRLAIGYNHTYSTDLRTVAVYRSEDGGEPVYVVPMEDRSRMPAPNVLALPAPISTDQSHVPADGPFDKPVI